MTNDEEDPKPLTDRQLLVIMIIFIAVGIAAVGLGYLAAHKEELCNKLPVQLANVCLSRP
ncbi:MAG: hypothetical protein WDN47_02855 [Candidatus Doudnabacteria bacterium]